MVLWDIILGFDINNEDDVVDELQVQSDYDLRSKGVIPQTTPPNP